jgi:hypothetical protein
MARVKFSAPYDHEWPSGAVTAYRNNWEGSVKEEVAVAAVAAGVARRTRLVKDPDKLTAAKKSKRGRGRPRKLVEGIKGGKVDQAEPQERLPGNLSPALAEPQALTPNLHVDEESKSE